MRWKPAALVFCTIAALTICPRGADAGPALAGSVAADPPTSAPRKLDAQLTKILKALVAPSVQPAGATTAPPVIPPRKLLSTVRLLRKSLVAVYQDISSDQDAAARPDAVAIDPEEKGDFVLPGTSTRIKLAGYARASTMFDTTQVGDRDQWVPSSIPVFGESNFGRGSQLNEHAKDSRLSFRLRRTLDSGRNLRVFFENDFFGSSTADLDPRVRHFYGQVGNVLLGHTFTAWRDPDSIPVTLDNQGPNGIATQRQVQIRTMLPLVETGARHVTLAASLEAPRSDLIGVLQPVDKVPDAVVTWRFEESKFHVQLGSIVRLIAMENAVNGRQDVTGWGFSASGGVDIGWRDRLMVQVSRGDGIGRYIQDTAGAGLDAALDARGELRALDISALVLGLKHRLSRHWQTNFSYGLVEVEPLASLGGLALTRSDYGAANLIYKPGTNGFIGFELLRGSREVASGATNDATRAQITIQYDLFR